MIESEEKRKRILDTLERFAKRTRIKWLLRDGDLSGLAYSIIEEFYNARLCCGHWVRSPYKEMIIEIPECDGTSIGTYCEDCGKDRLKIDGAKLLYTCEDGEIKYPNEVHNATKE